jgi:acyl-coenzyme A synthetase/AMP-(fatty) acid ligase
LSGKNGRIQTAARGLFVDELPKTATGKIQRFVLRGRGVSAPGA